MTAYDMRAEQIARRLGVRRLSRIWDHQAALSEHRWRQCELAATVAVFLLMAFATTLPLQTIAMLYIQIGITECRRMNGSGRSYRCNRSVEMCGL